MDKLRKVAIIAVHGVGVHPPGETQNDMADLLLSLPPRAYSAPRAYEPFRSVSIQIPLSPFKAVPFHTRGAGFAPQRSFWPRVKDFTTNFYKEQSSDFAETTHKSLTTVPPVGDAGRRYTQMLLENYEGGSAVAGDKYCTARLVGERIADKTKVHIYEVLWADLAKPANGFLKFFLVLFQMLLHLASLSRIVIDTGVAEGDTFVWRRYRQCQRYAVRMLQIFAPLLQLLTLVACGSCLSTASSYTYDKAVLPLAMGALAGVLFGLIFILWVKNKITIGPWLWSLLAIMPAIVGIAISLSFMLMLQNCYGLKPEDSANVTAALAFWLLPGTALFTLILLYYEDFRKGARATGIVLFASAFLYFVVALLFAPANPSLPHIVDPANAAPISHFYVPFAAFWTAKVLLGYLRFSWFVIIILAFGASVLGSIAWRSEHDAGRRARAHAAVRTSRLALALPCVSFLLITLAIWASLIHLSNDVSSNPLFPDAVITSPAPHVSILNGSSPVLTWAHNAWRFFSHHTYALGDDLKSENSSPVTAARFIPAALAWSVGYQLPVTLALVAGAAFLLTWWALPSVITERFPFRNDAKNADHPGKAPRDTDNATSLHMGTWLSRGLDATSVVTFLLWSAIFLAPAAWILLFDFGTYMTHCAPNSATPLANWAHGEISSMMLQISALQELTVNIVYTQVVIGTVMLAALARSGGGVLAIVLDVDTYLRDTPVKAPPRARIFERYMSTLRYIVEFKDCDGRGYDEIVIVAHSLGALISGDLLHFLQSHYSREDAIHIPIKLLTMGNPARQLLNRFFPYLYDWIKSEPDNGGNALPGPRLMQPEPIPDTQLPNPRELGLKVWVSAYRSGDYVGRSLWLDEWYKRTPNDDDPRTHPPFTTRSSDFTRAEMCIGAGAHTHYMDDTAPDIAWILNDLI